MNDYVDQVNFLGSNASQIKVNVKQNDNNINENQFIILPENPKNDNENQNNLLINEIKNVKYQPYLEQNTFNNNNVFTEYDYIQNYSDISSNIRNISSKDYKILYNNTNINRNIQTKNIKILNKQNNYKSINKENCNNKSSNRQRNTTISFKPNKRTNLYTNYNNRNKNENSGKNNLKKCSKLNISKSEIQYPLNFYKNVPRNNSKYKEEKEKNLKLNKEENNDEEFNNKNYTNNNSKSKNGKINKYYFFSPNKIHGNSNKKTIRQSNSNYKFINKNNEIKSSDDLDMNYVNRLYNLKEKKINAYSNNENNTINSYKSCQNFYQKKGKRHNLRKKNEINMNMINAFNNYRYLNTIGNSDENNNNMNELYSDIYNKNKNDYYQNKSNPFSINIIDSESNNSKKKINNIILKNDNNFSFNTNNMTINAPRHIKGKKSFEIIENINNLNNKEISFNNIIDINKYIQYKKKLLNEFCHCLEEFIFINVKNNFDNFIFKLKEYCKEKYFNSLLLKRLQNKSIKKDFYKQRSSSSNKNILQNSPNPFYYSTIIDNMRREYDLQSDYMGRRTAFNYENNISPIFTEEGSRQNSRIEKNQRRYDIDNINNNYYMNGTHYRNLYENDRKNSHKERNLNNSYKKKFIDNTIYIPKKFKQNKNSNFSEKASMKKVKVINNYKNLNPNYNIMKKFYKKISLPENDVNKSQDMDNDIIKAKIKKNYHINYLKNNKNKRNNLQDISYDNKYSINKQIENGLLTQTNNNNIITKNKDYTTIVLNENKNKGKNKLIYKKKVKINKINSKMVKNKLIQQKNQNEISNINKKEYKKLKSITIPNEGNNNSLNRIENNGNKVEKTNIDSVDKKSKNINNNKLISLPIQQKNNNGNNEDNNKEIEEKENINEANDINNIDPNEMSNGNNKINDEIEDNISREIIVKDVSTRDKRLNVFIKYIEIPQTNKNSNTFSEPNLINLFHTDSIYFCACYPPKNNYHNYYYGNSIDKKNKFKLHKILSSIIEEEEKSKAGHSANNSIISIEENYNNGNYSHFFIQSIKYLTNFLQSIFDDKKKDILFQFFKILKKIKNDSFLKGLINQKKNQTINKLKEEEEYENNTSGDIILYNLNDNFNVDFNYFGNEKRDIKKNKEDNNKQNEIKSIKDIKIFIDKEKIIDDKKYLSANNFYSLNKNILDIKYKRRSLSMDFELNKEQKDFDEYDDKKNSKLKIILENCEKNKNHFLIAKYFKNWEKNNEIKNESKKNQEENNSNREEEENKLNIDYEKNVTISEACRGLSDVILDFKVYLIKYCLGNKSN